MCKLLEGIALVGKTAPFCLACFQVSLVFRSCFNEPGEFAFPLRKRTADVNEVILQPADLNRLLDGLLLERLDGHLKLADRDGMFSTKSILVRLDLVQRQRKGCLDLPARQNNRASPDGRRKQQGQQPCAEETKYEE